jgi:hypothetical protein
MVAMRWLSAAVIAGVLALAAPAHAQTPVPAPVAAVCGSLFHVLHDDQIGSLVLAEGRYRITTFGTEAPTCFQASDLLRQFLEDWDGRLRRPWVTDAQLQGFTRGSGGTTGFALAFVPLNVPDNGGGGRHPATGAACPGFFHVLHDDFIGQFEVPAGWYRITVLGVGRLTCASASALLAEFLEDFNGRLPRGWRLDTTHGAFLKGATHNTGFRFKEITPDEPPNDNGGTHPASGSDRCPATFRVQNNDRIGSLRLRRGNYRITTSGRINCTAAASLFTEFLEHPEGDLPRPWRMDAQTASFQRGSSSNGFRVKPVRFRAPRR